MNLSPENKSYLELHLAVLLFGLTAILGDLIKLPAVTLVWWRVLLTSLSLVGLLYLWKIPRFPNFKLSLTYAAIGVIVAVHWVTFYGAIKLSNASIALVCMATASFFTSILEPIIMRQRFVIFDLMIGLLIVPGMVLIVNGLNSNMKLGILVGLISSFLAALFATLNKKYIGKADNMTITFVEMSSAWVFLSLLLPFYIYFSQNQVFFPDFMDWIYMIVLALLCTTFAYILALRSLRYLSAFASNLVVNLEPVYGILLAIFILKEHKELTPNFYWGVVLIVAVVFSYPILKKKFRLK